MFLLKFSNFARILVSMTQSSILNARPAIRLLSTVQIGVISLFNLCSNLNNTFVLFSKFNFTGEIISTVFLFETSSVNFENASFTDSNSLKRFFSIRIFSKFNLKIALTFYIFYGILLCYKHLYKERRFHNDRRNSET